MIKVRLDRGGKKHDPKYRIVAIEKTRKRSGKALDVIGHWDPKNEVLKLNKELLEKWVKNGVHKIVATKAKVVKKKIFIMIKVSI